MYIDSTLNALNTEQAWNTNTLQLQTLEAQLATGQANPSPANNPADTMISTQMQGQLGILTEQGQNTQQTTQVLNTILGTYQTLGSVLDQLRALTVQADAPTTNASDIAIPAKPRSVFPTLP